MHECFVACHWTISPLLEPGNLTVFQRAIKTFIIIGIWYGYLCKWNEVWSGGTGKKELKMVWSHSKGEEGRVWEKRSI